MDHLCLAHSSYHSTLYCFDWILLYCIDCGQYIVVEASDAVIIPEPNVRKGGGSDGGHGGHGGHGGQGLQTIEGVKQGIEDGATNPDGSNNTWNDDIIHPQRPQIHDLKTEVSITL